MECLIALQATQREECGGVSVPPWTAAALHSTQLLASVQPVHDKVELAQYWGEYNDSQLCWL